MRPVNRLATYTVRRLLALSILSWSTLTPAQMESHPPNVVKLEREASFHIPSGSLESALIQFSRQAGIQVVISARVAEISVAAIEGHLSARAVLATLLNGTGLAYRLVGNTVTIRPAAAVATF